MESPVSIPIPGPVAKGPRIASRKNLLHIDEIRFFVIHLILINHWITSVALVKGQVNLSLIGFWFELTSPCLSLISGYLFFYKTRYKFDFPKKLKARFQSLVVPYLFWSLSFFFVYIVIKKAFLYFFHSSFWYIPPKDLTFSNIIATIANPSLVNFWYIQNLILIVPFNYILYYLLKKNWIWFVFYAAVLIVYSYSLANLYFSPRFLPYYLLGCFLGYHEKRIPGIPLNKIATFVLILVLGYLGTRTSFLSYSGLMVSVLKILIAVFFLVSLFNLLDSNQKSWIFRYLEKYKPYSFFLFAINMFIFTIVQRTLFKIGLLDLTNKYNALFFTVFSAILVLVISLALGSFIKSRWSRFYFFITGR
jgi:hypothetical protein